MKKTGSLMSILLVAAFVLTAGCTEEFSSESRNDLTPAWTLTTSGDNYLIEFIDVQSADLIDVEWSILDLNKLLVKWDDPDGVEIRMEGGLDDINHSSTDYDNAAVKAYDRFYSRDPTGSDSRNHTLCVIFSDVNEDGKLSGGDTIWIRSVENDGAADEDFYFRLVNEKLGKAYGDKLLFGV